MTTMEPEEEPVCGACNRTANDHGNSVHPFSPKGASTGWLKPPKNMPPARIDVGGERVPTSMLATPPPFDPVLRQALINKGVVTPEELAIADKTIRALGLGGALGGSAESQEPAPGQ